MYNTPVINPSVWGFFIGYHDNGSLIGVADPLEPHAHLHCQLPLFYPYIYIHDQYS